MDMDKIITDLVEKRFEQALCDAVSKKFADRHGYDPDSLHCKISNRIHEIMDKVVKEREPQIRALLVKAVDEMVIAAAPIAHFGTEIKFNTPSHELKNLLGHQLRREGKPQIDPK